MDAQTGLRQTMSFNNIILSQQLHVSLALIAALGLSGCDENGKFNLAAATTGAASTGGDLSSLGGQTTELVERDVEAPDVFQVTGAGLWDGRPSLGGVWVAHPTVVDPERVIIRNEANGKFVIGALFRRESENPGPSLQVSSDAAEALGLLAGAPTKLNVTALRRQEAPVVAAPDATIDFDTPAEISQTALDPIAGAAAAIDAAEAAVAPAPAAQASDLSKPFVQIGIFSVETNAESTAEKLRKDGMSAKVIAQTSQGRNFWRVIVGPAATEADRAATLAKVKTLGFSDAYFATN